MAKLFCLLTRTSYFLGLNGGVSPWQDQPSKQHICFHKWKVKATSINCSWPHLPPPATRSRPNLRFYSLLPRRVYLLLAPAMSFFRRMCHGAPIRLCLFNDLTEPSVPIYRPNIQLRQCLVVPRLPASSQAAQSPWLSGLAAGDTTAGQTPAQPLVSSEDLIRLCSNSDIEKLISDHSGLAPV